MILFMNKFVIFFHAHMKTMSLTAGAKVLFYQIHVTTNIILLFHEVDCVTTQKIVTLTIKLLSAILLSLYLNGSFHNTVI